jgi:uncharacterized membrane protein
MASGHYDPEIKSTAAIAGHPIHPMLIPFPVAFLVGALVTDIAFVVTGDGFWARASLWLIGAGIATALFAAIFGFTDFATIKRIRDHSIAWWHMGLNLTAVALSVMNLLPRLGDAADAVMPLGIILSALVTGALSVSGWLGGEMSYRHKIGVYSGGHADAEEVETNRAYSSGD